MLLLEGDADIAASRAYYGCFYVAKAPLLDEGLSFSSHGSVIGEYGRLFARTEHLDRRFHRLLTRTFAARQAPPTMTSTSIWTVPKSTRSSKS